MNALYEWMRDWGVPAAALPDLLRRMGANDMPAAPQGEGSEDRQQGLIRLAAPRNGMTLWRNNVGVLPDKRNVPLRFGLANDTPAMNKRTKSADLIGIHTREITPQMVGWHVGQFASIEVKHESWHWRGDAHELAQLNWALIVQAKGGDARFLTSPDQL